VEIQQAVVGLQSLYKASTSQPKVNTSRPIQTKVYRKSSVQGFASNRTKARQKRKQDRKSGNTTNSCRAAKPLQGQHESTKSKHAQGKTDKAIKTSVQGMAKAPQTTTKKRKYNKELFRVKVVARPMRINQK
jgi:hypothetical protein